MGRRPPLLASRGNPVHAVVHGRAPTSQSETVRHTRGLPIPRPQAKRRACHQHQHQHQHQHDGVGSPVVPHDGRTELRRRWPRPGPANHRYGVEEGALRTGEGSKRVSEPGPGARALHYGASLVAVPPVRAPNTLFDVSPVEAAPSSAPHRSLAEVYADRIGQPRGLRPRRWLRRAGAVVGGGRGLGGAGGCHGFVLVLVG